MRALQQGHKHYSSDLSARINLIVSKIYYYILFGKHLSGKHLLGRKQKKL